jgi:hypothetical protein
MDIEEHKFGQGLQANDNDKENANGFKDTLDADQTSE